MNNSGAIEETGFALKGILANKFKNVWFMSRVAKPLPHSIILENLQTNKLRDVLQASYK